MMLDDGRGIVIDTDSKEMTTEQKLRNLRAEYDGLERVYKELSRSDPQQRKEKQRLRALLDTKIVEYRNLHKKYRKEHATR